MAFEERLESTTRIMTTDYSAKQYMFCDLDSADKGVVPAAAANCFGIVQNKPTAGQAAQIAVRGASKCVAGGVVAGGALVACDVQGRAVTATTGNYILGRALLPAAGAGVVITVELQSGGKL